MSKINVEVTAVIEAAPKGVYSVLSDYPGGHHAILPKEYLTSLSVIEGGQGDGNERFRLLYISEIGMNWRNFISTQLF